jgi:hypothetical protein
MGSRRKSKSWLVERNKTNATTNNNIAHSQSGSSLFFFCWGKGDIGRSSFFLSRSAFSFFLHLGDDIFCVLYLLLRLMCVFLPWTSTYVGKCQPALHLLLSGQTVIRVASQNHFPIAA